MGDMATPGEQAAEPRPVRRGRGALHSVTPARFLARLRYQMLLGVLVAVVLPPLVYYYDNLRLAWTQPSSVNTVIGSLAAFLIAIYLFRRVVTLPGLGVVGHV